jgi:hypothetical protein
MPAGSEDCKTTTGPLHALAVFPLAFDEATDEHPALANTNAAAIKKWRVCIHHS